MIVKKKEPEPKLTVETATDEACQPTKNIGLRGVVVADTAICNVDGQKGVLTYRGFDIQALADHATYEEVVHLLLHGALPTKAELAALKASLAEERYLPSAIVDAMRTLPAQTRPMDVLQAMVPMLGAYDPDLADESRAANGRKALRLIARFPLIVSAWYRLRQGLDIVRPSPDLNHAANFLYTMHGVKPDPETARDMDVILVVHAEHSFNASTFACRQVASTQAHIYASIGAALGALSGDLHGGANEEVRRMFEIIGAKENARDYVIKTLDAGGKIMGMGHAVYKTVDPRARFLQPMARRLAEQTGDFRWFEINEEVAQVTAEEFKRRKNIAIYPNVDFYAATVYSLMGIPTDLFTPIFAVARVAGYAAHFMEERFAEAQPKPALYRPGAEYVGRYCGEEGCEFVPLDERG